MRTYIHLFITQTGRYTQREFSSLWNHIGIHSCVLFTVQPCRYIHNMSSLHCKNISVYSPCLVLMFFTYIYILLQTHFNKRSGDIQNCTEVEPWHIYYYFRKCVSNLLEKAYTSLPQLFELVPAGLSKAPTLLRTNTALHIWFPSSKEKHHIQDRTLIMLTDHEAKFIPHSNPNISNSSNKLCTIFLFPMSNIQTFNII